MKYNEEMFKQELYKMYGGDLLLVGRYKNLVSPVMLKDKYGVLKVKTARLVLKYKPNINAALNKTEYFMNMLKEKYPDTYTKIRPESEYKTMKEKMLFSTDFGLISITPDSLIHGHVPNIRSAVDRKEYFKNQLLFIYNNLYEFIISNTSRKEGRVELICPIHGKLSVDSDTIFNGCGCPKCNQNNQSDLFYLIKLYNDSEWFYKLGISHKNNNGNISRFNSYKALGYNIDIIKIIQFNNYSDCKEFELDLKLLIKNYLYSPKLWRYNSFTESFLDNNCLNTILNNIKNIRYDIVSTSSENLSKDN